jgi:hypothetical protein
VPFFHPTSVSRCFVIALRSTGEMHAFVDWLHGAETAPVSPIMQPVIVLPVDDVDDEKGTVTHTAPPGSGPPIRRGLRRRASCTALADWRLGYAYGPHTASIVDTLAHAGGENVAGPVHVVLPLGSVWTRTTSAPVLS